MRPGKDGTAKALGKSKMCCNQLIDSYSDMKARKQISAKAAIRIDVRKLGSKTRIIDGEVHHSLSYEIAGAPFEMGTAELAAFEKRVADLASLLHYIYYRNEDDGRADEVVKEAVLLSRDNGQAGDV